MKTMSNERILKRYGVVDENGNIKNNKVQAINFIYGTDGIKDGYIGKEFNLFFSNDNLIYYGRKEYFGNAFYGRGNFLILVERVKRVDRLHDFLLR